MPRGSSIGSTRVHVRAQRCLWQEENPVHRAGAVAEADVRAHVAWRALSWFRFIPRFLADLGYRFVARIRFRVWGRRDACRVPTPDERARFLDVA